MDLQFKWDSLINYVNKPTVDGNNTMGQFWGIDPRLLDLNNTAGHGPVSRELTRLHIEMTRDRTVLDDIISYKKYQITYDELRTIYNTANQARESQIANLAIWAAG